jgi:hypothetical protein
MTRKKTPDGKRVLMAAKVSEPVAAAVDAARGMQTRSAWIQDAIAAKLAGEVKTAPAVPARAVSAPYVCPHPKARVIKGRCWACGASVG